MALHKHITLLPGNVAQRIAAGEVIDRPNAVLRELLDNAIDAGADTIDVHIQKGGIDSIRVIDNGNGMSKEDLELCCKSHATSKISKISDLDELNTLGFRGEALNSISVSSELKIITKVDAENCYTLETAHGDEEQIYPGGSAKGSTVEVRNLFHAIPARKKFLKSPQGEAAACKKTCIEKALPFPEIQFRFYSNGVMKFFLPVSSQLERVQNAYSHLIEKNFLKKLEVSAGNFSFTAILSSPSLHRTDRSYIQVFINKRRIQEYSLVQAVTYGYDSFLPGGTFPYCFLFVNVQSDLVDFNIHPAKREVKLRNLREIHHQIVIEIKKFLAENSNSKPSFSSYTSSDSENELQNPEFEGIGSFPNRAHDREPTYKE
ncbi:MAG: DNA mismatch repair endonuclease MutL, partial [Spirochaetales bacterium]|nr:DNA mismatch repair endonuclease MutL [Spirochaetales bacterium]